MDKTSDNSMEMPATRPEAYMPLVSIAFISVLAAHVMRDAYGARFMPIFMSFWLIQFALVKLFDVQGFVDMFERYDLVASRVRGYGYLFPFIELALGLAYLGNYAPFYTSIVLLIVAFLGLASVLLNRNKSKLHCACMGTVAKVPLGRITIVESLLMLLMGAALLAQYMNQ